MALADVMLELRSAPERSKAVDANLINNERKLESIFQLQPNLLELSVIDLAAGLLS